MNAGRTDEETGFQIGYERAKYGFCRQDLDAMGERAVRDALNSGKHGHAGLPPFEFVSAWLADAEFVRLADSSAKRDAREEATLSVAKEANAISRFNRIVSISAAIIAAVAAIAAIVAAIAAVKGLH